MSAGERSPRRRKMGTPRRAGDAGTEIVSRTGGESSPRSDRSAAATLPANSELAVSGEGAAVNSADSPDTVGSYAVPRLAREGVLSNPSWPQLQDGRRDEARSQTRGVLQNPGPPGLDLPSSRAAGTAGIRPAGTVSTEGLPEKAVVAPDRPREAVAAEGDAFDPPRIAVYRQPQAPPLVLSLDDLGEETDPATFIEVLASRSFALAHEQGSRIPASVFRELAENLIHASFMGVVITILDAGNTVRVSDRGPGIPDKQAALRPGFTSADKYRKRYIRGVGSGFTLVKETLDTLGGTLEIEDNLGRGTVVTVRVPPLSDIPLAPPAQPSYNLSERQLKTLLLTVELAPVGPTRIAEELGVSASTTYRDLVQLEQAGLVVCQPSGHRLVTEAGLAFLSAVL